MLNDALRIYTLGSGSSGNSVFVSSGRSSLLIDAGLSMRATERALVSLGTCLADVEAIIITHEHSDHIKGLEKICGKYRIPVYLPSGCLSSLIGAVDPALLFPIDSDGGVIEVGDVRITAFRTPHDSADSAGYVIEIRDRRFGLVTDIGRPTKSAADALLGCERVIIEANYDRIMLENGPYPLYLRRRIASARGHLENTDCAKMIAYIALEGRATHFMLAHLSDKNNTPALALETVDGFLKQNGVNVSVSVAERSALSCLIDECV